MAHLTEAKARLTGRLMAIIQYSVSSNDHHDEALARLRALHTEAQETLGKNHELTFNIFNYIQERLSESRSPKESADVFDDLYEEGLKYLPIVNPILLRISNNRAKYIEKGRSREAGLEIYRQMIDEREKLLGKNHLRSSVVRQNYALALRRSNVLEDLEKAEQITREELQLRIERWGEKHSLVQISRMNLIQTLIKIVENFPQDEAQDKARLAEALELTEFVATQRKLERGTKTRTTIRAYRRCAELQILLGNPERAVWLLKHLVSLEKNAHYKESSQTLVYLALALQKSSIPGSDEEAEKLVPFALQQVAEKYGESSPELIDAQKRLGVS